MPAVQLQAAINSIKKDRNSVRSLEVALKDAVEVLERTVFDQHPVSLHEFRGPSMNNVIITHPVLYGMNNFIVYNNWMFFSNNITHSPRVVDKMGIFVLVEIRKYVTGEYWFNNLCQLILSELS